MEKKKKTKRMRELVELLNKARRAYEQENTEIMSNFEYDRLYDELLSLEKELETSSRRLSELIREWRNFKEELKIYG